MWSNGTFSEIQWERVKHSAQCLAPYKVFNKYLMTSSSFCGSAGKESTCSAGDLRSIPGLRRSTRKGIGYPPQYSGLENSMDCIIHGVAKSRMLGGMELDVSWGKEERRVGQEKCHPHLKKGRQVLYADEEEPELCFQKSLHRKFYSSWERRSPPGRWSGGDLPPLESMEKNRRACPAGGWKEDAGKGNRLHVASPGGWTPR